MDALGESPAPTNAPNETFTPFEHWTYRVESPFRPVNELVEASSTGSGRSPGGGSWEPTEPRGGSVTLEALEALEDFQGEDEESEDEDSEDLEDSEQFESLEESEDEDSEDFEDTEDSEEGESGYEELGAFRSSAPRGPGDIGEDRDRELGEDEFEEGEDLDTEELIPRRFRGAVIVGSGGPGRRRRIFLHRGDTLVVKWR
jgi:hypothetical protein